MSDLTGRTAVVTGGGSGIGAAIARGLADAGCRVAITGRRQERLDDVTDNCSGPVPILARPSDVANRQGVHEFFEWAREELGQIDILVNSAGINTPVRAVATLDPADWDKLIAVNLTGAYNCIHEVLPGMRQRQDGIIINISSVAGKRAGPIGGVAYNASKFGMAALGTTVAEEHRELGIRVTNVYPGEVETPILDDRPVPVTAEHRARILQPEDVADAVLMVVGLPARANVPELIVIPTTQSYR